jgi:uncharacterized protein (TIGR00375 family)
MKITADLHIHSRFSRATSKKLNPASLDRWARIKGIELIGTGDCTHPAWLAELREQLEDAEDGFFTLKKEVRGRFDADAADIPAPFGNAPRFVLTGEISTIYKKNGKTRKVHHVVILPDFQSASLFQAKLERAGNIRSDGRPILGLDSHDLLALLVEADDRSILIPAHIWTPWFSALSANSGFNSIDECYGDLAPLIPAIETGLSSNPPMNWAVSSLDRFSIISNSDAHSPDKLGREATAFAMDWSFQSFSDALRMRGTSDVLYTVELYPQEGKYHYDGHRKCGISVGPAENNENFEKNAGKIEKICPVCGKPLTKGVMGRVLELADRPVDEWEACPPDYKGTNRRPYVSLIPLRELSGELLGTGGASKKVDAAYNALIRQAGSELSLLIDLPVSEIEKLRAPGIAGERLASAVSRMRNGQVFIQAGYDGEYGVIRVFPDVFPHKKEKKGGNSGTPIFLRGQDSSEDNVEKKLDAEQEQAVSYEGKAALVIAGPGAGKTSTLTARIAHLLRNGAEPSSILALAFTGKAALELRERIERAAITAETFHSFCAAFLRDADNGFPPDFTILNETERDEVLKEILSENAGVKLRGFGVYLEARKRFLRAPYEEKFELGKENTELALIAESLGLPEFDPEKEFFYRVYQEKLKQRKKIDFDGLIMETARLLAQSPEIREKYREQYRFIFVDEYQDLNFAQYALMRLLTSGEKQKLWVIGDPNQSIYSFRGADKRLIDRFLLDYPNAAVFRLRQSFRCAAPIMNAAGMLVNAEFSGADREVSLFRASYADENAEARAIASKISALIGGASFFAFDSGAVDSNAGGESLDDIGILLRTSNLAPPLLEALNKEGIPYQFIDEKPWWEEEPAASLLQTLREKRGNAEIAGLSPQEAVEFFWKNGEKKEKKGKKKKEKEREKENEKRARLIETASFYGDTGAFLDALDAGAGGDGAEITSHGVRVMTIHSSKGLEFSTVFVPAVEDGLLPFTLFGDKSAEHLNEERRLLYVAMTRAKSGLYLSWARKRFFQNRLLENQPSPFLTALETLIPLAESRPLKPKKQNPQPSLF